MNLKQLPRLILEKLGFRLFRQQRFYEQFLYYNQWGFSSEPVLRHFINCKEVRVCIDAGANKGQTALYLAGVFPAATIYSFEPVRATYEILRQNTREIKAVKTFNLALGEGEMSVVMKTGEDDQRNSLVEIPEGQKTVGCEEVGVTCLDSFVEHHHLDRIHWLKTDTEGYDLQVLRGAERTLAAGLVDFVYCEVGFDGKDRQHTYFGDVLEFLVARGFRFIGLFEAAFFDSPSRTEYANALFASTTSALTHEWR